MTATRSFTNPFGMTDFTEELITVNNKWSLVNDMGLFRDEPVTQNNVTIEVSNQTVGLITDSYRGSGRNKVNKDDNRKLISLILPHFSDYDYISPSDLVAKRAYGKADEADTMASVMERKMRRLKRSWDDTMEQARCQAITGLSAYAPNGTVSYSYLTEFGGSQTTVNFVLSSPTTDINTPTELVYATVQDNVQSGETVTAVRVLCSPEWFSAYVGHVKNTEAYNYFSSQENNNPNRDRLGGQGNVRRFLTKGVEFVEYRGVGPTGARLIPANEAYAIPLGTQDMFISHYGPCEKFGMVNTLAEKQYLWTYMDQYDEKIEIFTESNFLNIVRRPTAIVKLTKS